jgi:1,4-dihydroxy-2-naphthoate octaprenyltransferase
MQSEASGRGAGDGWRIAGRSERGSGGGWQLWLAGARPRTLGVAVAPVLVGTAAVRGDGSSISWLRALLALVVALALQVGVNYANDYSDGVRGTDTDRRGPVRLTASGLASPAAVRTAAMVALGVAAAAGFVLAAMVSWWLLLVGIAAIAAAALYTGGPRPYGYSGFGEVMVLVFFGFVATAGSAFVQAEQVPATAWWGSLVVGAIACAILLVNNIRDVATDERSGKRTLAVRIGDRNARMLFGGCLALAYVAVVAAAVDAPWALLALATAPVAFVLARRVSRATAPPELVAVLVATARLDLATAILLAVGLWIA